MIASAVLSAHAGNERGFLDEGELWCATCLYRMPAEEIADHQLEMLAEHGHAVVKLPIAKKREHVAYGDRFMVDDFLGWKRSQMTAAPEGMQNRGEPYRGPYIVQYMNGASGNHYTPESARQYAAALLAAADHAEQLMEDQQ